MNNLYRKIAVASVCTALGFALGANKEAKAATFNTSSRAILTFHAIDGGSSGRDGLGDEVDSVMFPYDDFPQYQNSWYKVERTTVNERAALTEFSLPNSIRTSTGYRTDIRITKITNAVFGFRVWHWPHASRPLGLFGYIGNGTAEASDFEAGVFLDSITFPEHSGQFSFASFNVAPFLNELVSNNNKFAGFAVRSLSDDHQTFFAHPDERFRAPLLLNIEGEYEVVPEPTTIFGSALALGVGGWLKRKKSSKSAQ
jgi:hypothetical protein